jgi:hypothetical protein
MIILSSSPMNIFSLDHTWFHAAYRGILYLQIPEVSARLAAEKRLFVFRRFVDLASQTIQNMRDRCLYRWVNMESLCISVT